MSRFILSLFITLVLAAPTALAQQHKPPHQPPTPEERARFVAEQSQKLAEELQLDAATTTQFRTLYAQYAEAMHVLREKFRPLAPPSTVESEEEIEARLLAGFQKGHDILQLREQYYRAFRKFLRPSQLHQMYKLEQRNLHRFHRQLKKNQEVPQE